MSHFISKQENSFIFNHKFFAFSNPKLVQDKSRTFLGLILVFEWWYFKRNGQSFIEQMSLNHLGPLINPDPNDPLGSCEKVVLTRSSRLIYASEQPGFECKVWQNPMNLLRGAEYERYYSATKKQALTFYDLNLSAQDHQTFFTCDSDKERKADSIMTGAWRERYVKARIEAAQSALQIEPDNPSGTFFLQASSL